ncbi:MAG: DUF2878 domain-containing protein [Xanthomonadaceae bacterium]|jgi:hypothetical protein|nr:DUF2878 domain-containing protein [Xanthomonadaceae bacterium]MDE3071328.1 DUF2878 domain-containing protein [Pseudomonadota bacterium]
MNFWISLIGYQLVWFASVTGAGHGLAWPGALGLAVYAAWQLSRSPSPATDMKMMTAATLLGCLLDGGLIHCGLASYAVAAPLPALAPLWILALWAAFALTFTQSLKYLQTRLWLALVLGAAGGPLAYVGAANGWQVISFATPAWRGLAWLAIGWGIATPLLAWLARHWSRSATLNSLPLREHAP